MGNEQSMLMINPRPNSTLSILDEESIVEICKYLKIFDLLQLAEVDIIYQHIIGEHIISKQTLNITEISPNYEVRDALECFGKFARELSIRESDIQYKNDRYTFAEEIFRLIKKRCNAERLKTITICFDSDDWREKSYNATKFLDVFAQVESITISKPTPVSGNFKARDKCLDEFLQKVLVHCTQLRSLKLINLSCDFGFLALAQLRQLRSMEFVHCKVLYDGWLKFMAGVGVRPHLETLEFDLTGFYKFHTHGVVPGTHCPHPHFCVPGVEQSQFLAPIAAAFPNLELFCLAYPPNMNLFQNPNGSAFQSFQKLRFLDLDGGEYPNLFEKLAVNATIEQLRVPMTGLAIAGIDKLVNLRFIELNDLHRDFFTVCETLAQHPRLEEITLHGQNYIADVHVRQLIRQIVTISPRLRLIKLCTSYSTLNSTFYKQMVNIRRNRFPNAPPLELYATFSSIPPSHLYAPNIVTIRRKPRNSME